MFKTNFTSGNDRFKSNFDSYEILKGEDGFSPDMVIVEAGNGHRVTVIDKDGETSFYVPNGKDGYTPVKGVDYFTNEDKSEIVTDILNEMPDVDYATADEILKTELQGDIADAMADVSNKDSAVLSESKDYADQLATSIYELLQWGEF